MTVTDDLSAARQLLLDLVELPDLVAGAAPDSDLISLGINSGDLLRLAVAVEERTGEPLGDEDLASLHTLDGIDQVLRAHGAADGQEAR
jgi:acyl carrier protein